MSEYLDRMYMDFVGKDAAGCNEKYEKNAKGYNELIMGVGYSDTAPKYIVETVLDLVVNEKETKVLDVGCGTGIVGSYFRKLGFNGVIDGLDGSTSMLDQAKDLKIYRDLKHHFIKPDTVRFDYDEDAYDAITCSGCMNDYHFDTNILDLFVKHLKIGGYFIYNLRVAKNKSFDGKLRNKLNELEQNGRIQKHSVVDVPFYTISDMDATEKTAAQYCYKKLK